MSDIAFDPGDMAEMEQIFGSSSPPQAMYDYVVCAKRQEILAPNLPLAWRLYAVDGYDGACCPWPAMSACSACSCRRIDILIDGRLREGLEHVPAVPPAVHPGRAVGDHGQGARRVDRRRVL